MEYYGCLFADDVPWENIFKIFIINDTHELLMLVHRTYTSRTSLRHFLLSHSGKVFIIKSTVAFCQLLRMKVQF